MPGVSTNFDAIDVHLLRAEAFVAELIDNGYTFDKFVIEYAGSFKKSYSNDIESVETVRQDRLTGDTVEIVLNRDGMYDRLPEGLFHQTRGNQRVSGVTAMVEEHRRFKEEEKNARKFFQPLEQEIFRAAVAIELEERNLLRGISGSKTEEIFFTFWDIDRNLPSEAARTLVRIMPWAGLIKGDLHLTAKTLSLVLNKEVSAERVLIAADWQQKESLGLGEELLGVSMMSGNGIEEMVSYWVFSIQGIPAGEILQYLGDNPYARLLKRFEELLIPVEADIRFDFGIEENEKQPAELVLGYSLIL